MQRDWIFMSESTLCIPGPMPNVEHTERDVIDQRRVIAGKQLFRRCMYAKLWLWVFWVRQRS